MLSLIKNKKIEKKLDEALFKLSKEMIKINTLEKQLNYLSINKINEKNKKIDLTALYLDDPSHDIYTEKLIEYALRQTDIYHCLIASMILSKMNGCNILKQYEDMIELHNKIIHKIDRFISNEIKKLKDTQNVN